MIVTSKYMENWIFILIFHISFLTWPLKLKLQFPIFTFRFIVIEKLKIENRTLKNLVLMKQKQNL